MWCYFMCVSLPDVVHLAAAPEFVRTILVHDLRRLRGSFRQTVICGPGPEIEDVREEGFQVIVVPIERKLSPFRDLPTLWRLWVVIRRARPAILQTYTPKAGLLGQVAGWLAGVPVRLHGCRGLLYQDRMPKWRRWLYRFTDRITFGLAARTLFVSAADLAFAIREGLIDASKAVYIGNGIDLRRFLPIEPDRNLRRDEARRSLGLPIDALIALSIGRFVADKGYEVTAAASDLLCDEFTKLRWVWLSPVLAGEEGVLSEAKVISGERGGRIKRVREMVDVILWLDAADVLVHASRREGVPRVLMEAAVRGTPIVASDIPGCREVVSNSDDCCLFSVDDSSSLAQAVRSVLRDRDATEMRAHRAQRVAVERHDQDRIAERIRDVYQVLLVRPR